MSRTVKPPKAEPLPVDTSPLNELAQAVAPMLIDPEATYERTRALSELKFYLARSAEAMWEVGKRLIAMKAHEPHGEFTRLVKEELGLSERTAQRWMAATRRYETPALKSKRQALAALQPSKLVELMSEADESLIELADGGEIAGMTLADVQGMTVAELVQKLGKAKSETEAKQRVIESLQTRNSELLERVQKPFKPDPTRLAQNREQELLIQQLRGFVLAAETGILQVAAFIDEFGDSHYDPTLSRAARQAIELLAQRVADLVNTHNVRVDLNLRPAIDRVGGA